MTKAMAEEMKGAGGPIARELADTTMAEIDKWKDHAISQAAGLYPNGSDAAAASAVGQIITDLLDYLPHSILHTLLAMELTGRITITRYE